MTDAQFGAKVFFSPFFSDAIGRLMTHTYSHTSTHVWISADRTRENSLHEYANQATTEPLQCDVCVPRRNYFLEDARHVTDSLIARSKRKVKTNKSTECRPIFGKWKFRNFIFGRHRSSCVACLLWCRGECSTSDRIEIVSSGLSQSVSCNSFIYRR